MRVTHNKDRRGFTLIELLVVIAIIGVLLSIALPSLSSARESSRRVKCLTNVKGIGTGMSLYMQTESKGLLPKVRPLHDDSSQNDPSLLDTLAAYVDAPLPLKQEDGTFSVTDPYRCPSDRVSDSAEDNFMPLWQTSGTSYEYTPGLTMIVAELFGARPDVVSFAVTKAYEKWHDQGRDWPVIKDQGSWHTLRKGAPAQNAVYMPDWRADWAIVGTGEEAANFFADVMKFAGM